MKRKSVEQLLEIFEPFEKKIRDVSAAIGAFKNQNVSNNESERLDRMKNTFILMLLRAFADSPINITIEKPKDAKMKYRIYWVDRRKYFKEEKKELMDFFSRFIRVVHSNENLTLVDLKISGNRRIILLIERSGNA